MMSFREQASWVKMKSPGGKLIANSTGVPPFQKVNIADELTYLFTNIANVSLYKH
jgi:hypothetical protein